MTGVSRRAVIGWALLLVGSWAALSGVHAAIAACHGEQSFDSAVAAQFLHLALNGWGPSGIVGSTAFGDHFNPLFLVPAPLFAIWPGTVSLQVFKTAVYLGGLPGLVLLARELLGRRRGAQAVFLVCLGPSLWVSLLADYHSATVAAGLIPWLLLAYERRRLGLCLGLAVAIALGKENLPLVVGGLGVLALVERRDRRWWISLGAIGGAIVVLGVGLIIPASSPVEGLGKVQFAHLATLSGWAASLSDLSLYRWLGFFLLSCGGLCLLAPRKLWPLVPLLLQHGLSIHAPERTIDFHYLAPILPLLAYAAFAGARRILPPPPDDSLDVATSSRRSARLIFGVLAAINLALLAGVGWRPATPNSGPGPFRRLSDLRSQAGVAALEAKIPPSAPAWTSLSTVSRMATRDRIYMVEALTLGHYLSRPWPFSPLAAFGASPPDHGLIDIRDPNACVPPGLQAIDAVGDVLLLAREGSPLVTPTEITASDRWVRAGDVSVRAGRRGRYSVILHTDAPPPMVLLTLLKGDERIEDLVRHRLLFGHSQRGAWETRYAPHALVEDAAPGPYRLYARLPGRSTPILLSAWDP